MAIVTHRFGTRDARTCSGIEGSVERLQMLAAQVGINRVDAVVDQGTAISS